MLHLYEIRELDSNGRTHIIKQFTEDPKGAKQKLKEYAEENPGMYSLYQIHRVTSCFNAKEE
nr:MAG TPA: hypothetical protein [Microviridae sp.]